ncbi:efflux RND transporter permease subunit [Brevundimonas aveniformis]|uniref:efflux RND transporter permease subunit n=1 Tax=Brevundimonas aveniformis TaxID=370977 RepID=UPI000409FE58|nr:efflux RND transporter permease subunit [Brevundimonas aveniformis]
MNGMSSWSIRNPIPIVLLFIVLTIAGLVSYTRLRTNNFPDVDLPVVVVTVVQPGAAPTELETQVTRLIEDSVAGLGQVRHIQSTVTDSASTTSIEFQLGVDLEKATNDVRNAVTAVRQSLPADVQEPIVQRVEFTGIPISNYVVRAPGMSPEQLSWFVDNDIAKRLLSVSGVSQVQRDGGVSREIRLKLDPARLEAYGVTASDVSNQLRAVNINLPGGRGEIGGEEQAIRTLGSAASIEDLRETRIVTRAGSSVRLADLGEVVDEWSEPRGRARFNGAEVVGFGVVRSIGSSEVDVSDRVQAEVEAIDAELDNVEIELVTTTTQDVRNNFHASVEALLLGAGLAVAVVFLFLRDWRATLVAAVAMPMSLIPTFWIMDLTGQSLNVVTLLALSLTVGILVDDAIVEIENIVRHMRDGKAPYPAAIEAADEIGLAVVATTATLVAVFAPTGFMPGVVGQFFKSFAIAACVSVLFSLLVARTLTPLMGAYLLKRDEKEHGDPFWMAGYQNALKWVLGSSASPELRAEHRNRQGGWFRRKVVYRLLDHRIWSLGLGALFFVFSLFLATQIPGEFIPVEDISRSTVQVELPPGATLEETDAAVRQVTAVLAAREEVTSIYSSVGSATFSFGPGGGGSSGEVRRANLTVNLVPKAERRLSQSEFETEIGPMLRETPGARVSFGQEGGGGGRMSVSLVGDDPAVLEPVATAVEREMRGIEGLNNVTSSASLVRPEILITPRQDLASRLGVTSADISQVARVATLGDADQLLPKFNLGDRQVPIRVMLAVDAREDLSVIENLRVPTSTGTLVPLSAVADISFGAGPNQISRLDRRRVATISAELGAGATLGGALESVRALPSMQSLPSGVMEAPSGEAESFQELGLGFAFALVTGILLMYVVLVLLFGSFFHPITILAALPVSFGGAFLALMLTGRSLSMPALIGIIMLTGIAAKNSILLVDYAIIAMKEGMGRYDAILDAAHKRARPILMTTLAMGLGMLPIAMAVGEGTEFRSPMAIAVIGGLITSTVLSLLFVPVVFSVIDGIKTRLERVLDRAFADQKAAADEMSNGK